MILQSAAITAQPIVQDLLGQLRDLPDVQLARMSGSGAHLLLPCLIISDAARASPAT